MPDTVLGRKDSTKLHSCCALYLKQNKIGYLALMPMTVQEQQSRDRKAIPIREYLRQLIELDYKIMLPIL